MFLIMSYINQTDMYYYSESVYVSSIMIIAIYVFSVFTFLTLLSSFDVRFFKTLGDFKRFGVVYPFNLVFLVTILSFAGVPPLFGFSIKLLLFLSIAKSAQLLFVLVLAVFNFFTLYFYIQNVRYVVGKAGTNFHIYTNYTARLNETTTYVILITLLVNVFGIFILSDL